MGDKLKKEELEVPQDLKETPKQRSWDRKVILSVSLILALLLFGAIAYFSRTKPVSYKSTVPQTSPTTSTSLNPGTGNLYNDVQIRLNEVIK